MGSAPRVRYGRGGRTIGEMTRMITPPELHAHGTGLGPDPSSFLRRPRATAPEPPTARGDLSEYVLSTLRKGPDQVTTTDPKLAVRGDPLLDDDLHLALYCCYELHYRGWAGVDAAWEWHPALLTFRAGLERAFEAAV